MVDDTHMADYDALDACHRQTLSQLQELSALSQLLEDASADAEVRARARARARVLDSFFSGTSAAHHAEEEATVFPSLLASGDAELVQTVSRLQQDHGWLERDWALLGPQLQAIAKGESWPEPAEFQHGVTVFVQLYLEHIALEETLIYPQSKAHWAKVVAQRAARPPA